MPSHQRSRTPAPAGRRPAADWAEAARLLALGTPARAVARRVGCLRSRILRKAALDARFRRLLALAEAAGAAGGGRLSPARTRR